MDQNLGQVKLDENKPDFSSIVNRFAAYLVDIFIIGILGGVFGTILGTTEASLLSLVIMACYFGYFHSKDGQSLGMKIVGIKISKEDGKLLDGVAAVLRTLTFWILTPLTLSISNLIAIFSVKKQALHDMIFQTVYTNVDTSKNGRGKYIAGCSCALGCLFPILLFVLITIGAISATSVPGNQFLPKNNQLNLNNQVPETKNPEVETPKNTFESQIVTDQQYQETLKFLDQLTFNIVTFDSAKKNCLNSVSRIYQGNIVDVQAYCTCEAKIVSRNGLQKDGFRDSDITNKEAVNRYCAIYTSNIAPLKFMPKDVIKSAYTDQDVKKYLSSLKLTVDVAKMNYNACLATANLRVLDQSSKNIQNYCTCEASIMSSDNLTKSERTDNYLKYCSIYIK
jgi:uncharacterized RDD family membrane protein YckC